MDRGPSLGSREEEGTQSSDLLTVNYIPTILMDGTGAMANTSAVGFVGLAARTNYACTHHAMSAGAETRHALPHAIHCQSDASHFSVYRRASTTHKSLDLAVLLFGSLSLPTP